MPAVILPLLSRFAPWILGVVLLAGLLLYGWHLEAALRAARAEVRGGQGTIARLMATNSENRAELARLTADETAWQTALTTAAAADAHGVALSQRILTAVAAAPPTQDGAVAPVLAGALSELAAAQGGRAKP
ncbi:hypothetical protein [Acidiphilium sp.]|uniref:hypothetical protein n=1 Tax=Acidiphilium sp. TaxID=527 RepID=UPI00258E0198|nr:hypothetical protein [Acidiphilium sp.]